MELPFVPADSLVMPHAASAATWQHHLEEFHIPESARHWATPSWKRCLSLEGVSTG